MLRDLIRSVYEANLERWTRYWLSRTGKTEDADDIIHDAIARTLDADPPLETEGQTAAYLWQVMRTTSVRAVTRPGYKFRSQEVTQNLHLSDAAASPLDVLLSSDDAATRKRMLMLAWKHLRRLPRPIRECVELHVFHEPGMTTREIAVRFGIGKSTVADRVKKGLDMIVAGVLEELEADE